MACIASTGAQVQAVPPRGVCPVSAELHPTSLRSRSTCPCHGPHRLRSSGRKQLPTGDARTQTWGLSGCRTSANAQQPLLWTCPEVGPLQSDVLVAADVCCSPSPPGAARGAGPADASRGKAGGGRRRVSDPAGLGAAVCTSRGGGAPRGHRREDRRCCRVLGAQRCHQTELRFTETDARAETQRRGRRAGPGAAAEHPQPHPPCFGAWWKFSTSNMYILFFTVFPPKKL